MDVYAEIARLTAAGDIVGLSALANQLAAAHVERDARRERAREKKRRQRAMSPSVPICPGDNRGQIGTNGDTQTSDGAINARVEQVLQEQEPVQQQPALSLLPAKSLPAKTQLTLVAAKAAPRGAALGAAAPVLALVSEEAPAPASKRKRAQPLDGGDPEKTPKLSKLPPKLPPIPAPWLDFLHRIWSMHGGVVEIPRFRRAIGPALRTFTVGQIERAMKDWVSCRNGKAIKLEFFIDELAAAVKAVDEGGAMFLFPPEYWGLTAEEMAANQAAHRARMRDEDLAFMAALLDDTPTPPAPPPDG